MHRNTPHLAMFDCNDMTCVSFSLERKVDWNDWNGAIQRGNAAQNSGQPGSKSSLDLAFLSSFNWTCKWVEDSLHRYISLGHHASQKLHASSNDCVPCLFPPGSCDLAFRAFQSSLRVASEDGSWDSIASKSKWRKNLARFISLWCKFKPIWALDLDCILKLLWLFCWQLHWKLLLLQLLSSCKRSCRIHPSLSLALTSSVPHTSSSVSFDILHLCLLISDCRLLSSFGMVSQNLVLQIDMAHEYALCLAIFAVLGSLGSVSRHAFQLPCPCQLHRASASAPRAALSCTLAMANNYFPRTCQACVVTGAACAKQIM